MILQTAESQAQYYQTAQCCLCLTIRFDELRYGEATYAEILRQLAPKRQYATCHLDPDIREGVRIEPVPNWKPGFGQIGEAESHLRKTTGVGSGDLFLFFGWFRNTSLENGKLKFTGQNIQAIYGYLQIKERLTGEDVGKYPWHPHSADERKNALRRNNTIYTATNHLTLDGRDMNKQGYGVFQFNKKYQLTKDGESRTKWNLLDWMYGANISCHKKTAIKENYFQSNNIGQEFVIESSPQVISWVKSLFAD